MSDLSRYDREPSPSDLYGAACKGFHQAKCMLESLVTPTDEVKEHMNDSGDIRGETQIMRKT